MGGGAMQIARRLPFHLQTASSKRVFTEISNLVRVSNIRWRGRSFATSVPSDSHKIKKGRVSRAERKAMVESFVNKYKSMNLGKFPTVSDAKKEVGGSYYVIREILQELEYKSKISSVNTRDETSVSKELTNENKISTGVEEVSSSRTTIDARKLKDAQTIANNSVDVGDSTCKHFEVKEGPHISNLVENELLEEVGKPTVANDNSTYSETHEKREDNIKETTPSEDVLNFEAPKPKAEQHQQLHESEKFARKDPSDKQTDEELNKEKPSMWGNLKSLADGIIKMWRER